MKTVDKQTKVLLDEIAVLRQKLAIYEKRGTAEASGNNCEERLKGLVSACTRELRAAGQQIKEERELARLALSRSEELFAKVFKHSPDMIAIQRMKDDVYIDANPAFLNTLGYKREEVVGYSTMELGIWASGTQLWKNALQDLQKHGELKAFEHQLRTKSGCIISVLSSVVLLDIGDEPCRVKILKNITALKKYEEKMVRLDRLDLIAKMAGSIAHEIRNPMTSIRGFLQLMSERDASAENRGYYTVMIEELDRANAIISDYLGMVRQGVSERRPRYLNSIIRAIYPMVLADANMRGQQVKLKLGTPPQLNLDEKEIRQMVLNLIRNGLEAMPPGGTLTISTGTENGHAVLSIKDEGPGLDASIREELGTPFLTTKKNGTGLGLAVCYGVAARNDAVIKVDTGPGGTTFTVRFSASGVVNTKDVVPPG